MKKLLIIIEDEPMVRLLLLMAISQAFENDMETIHKEKSPREILESMGFEVRLYEFNATVIRDFPEGIPEYAVTILDGYITDGKTTVLLPFFNKKARERTIIFSANKIFKKLAREEGFGHIIAEEKDEKGDIREVAVYTLQIAA